MFRSQSVIWYSFQFDYIQILRAQIGEANKRYGVLLII